MKRRPHFHRPFQITARDEGILQAIARFRLLTAPLVTLIVGGSPRGVHNRLRILSANKMLVRIARSVTEPLTYGLATKGARYLADRGFPINHRLDWTANNRRTDYFRTHTLAVAQTLLHFDRAVAMHDIALVDHHEIHQHFPEHTQNSKRAFSLHVSILQGGNKSINTPIVPDRLFALFYPDARHNFALEQDCGTMDIWANRLVGKSSIRRKHLAYFRARELKHFATKWDFTSFRVLIVTTSEARIQSMIRAQRRALPCCPPGFFLYSTLERLTQFGALGPAWTTTKRDNVSLLPTTGVTPRFIDDSAPSADAAERVKREMEDMPCVRA